MSLKLEVTTHLRVSRTMSQLVPGLLSLTSGNKVTDIFSATFSLVLATVGYSLNWMRSQAPWSTATSYLKTHLEILFCRSQCSNKFETSGISRLHIAIKSRGDRPRFQELEHVKNCIDLPRKNHSAQLGQIGGRQSTLGLFRNHHSASESTVCFVFRISIRVKKKKMALLTRRLFSPE